MEQHFLHLFAALSLLFGLVSPSHGYANDHQQKIRQVSPDTNITPIPMENLNPRLTEFRRVDTSGDERISFTEFLMGDRPFIEDQSRRFHQLDKNSDGFVSRKEFETDEGPRGHNNMDNFFKQLGTSLYPGSDDRNNNNFHYHHELPPTFFSYSHQFPPSPSSSSSSYTGGGSGGNRPSPSHSQNSAADQQQQSYEPNSNVGGGKQRPLQQQQGGI